MKYVFLIALMLGAISAASAQTTSTGAEECTLTLAQAPAIRGIRLGMTVDQVVAVIPGAEADSDLQARLSRDHFGLRSARVTPGNYVGSKQKFAGVNTIDLFFLDGRLANFSIGYAGLEWRSNEQFAARVAEALNLPGVASWKNVGELALQCDGFQMSVQPNHITMKDLGVDIDKVVRERSEVPKEKARRDFKP